MRNIGLFLALVLAACSGENGKDGAPGAAGPAGPAGVNGKDGDDGKDGAPGANGTNGTNGKDGVDGKDGADGEDGTDGADGSAILKGTGAPANSLGADGDVYIDTVSRDVYQKANGAWTVITNLSGGPAGPKGDKGDKGDDGTDGAAGASVRTGTGAPAAGLGNDGDVYIDSATGDLYSKTGGAWAKTGSLKGPAGDDGDDGVDVKDTVGGVRWFAFGLTAGLANAPSLVTSESYTDTESTATFTFTGANQHGRLGFTTAGSYLQGGVNLTAFESMSLTATVSGGTVSNILVLLTEGENQGCQWTLSPGGGPTYSIDLSNPANCYPSPVSDFTLASVTNVQIGIQSSGAGARTLTVTDVHFVDSSL